MNKNLLHDNFIKAIKEKVPSKPDLTNKLVDLLCIEKEAVYRRLRGEVAFTFAEIAIISHKMGISLDNTINSSHTSCNRPFQLRLIDYINPQERDYMMIQNYIDILKDAQKDESSSLVDCSNMLPMGLYDNFKQLSKYYLFKWIYQCGDTEHIKTFNDTKCPDRVTALRREYGVQSRHMKNSVYIFDPLIIQYIVTDIKHFNCINLITDEEVGLLKEDLHSFLNYLENLAIKGQFDDTGNSVYLYISSVNFDTSYWYIDSAHYHMNVVKAFILNNIISADDASMAKIKKRVDALIRSSTMISISGELQRIEFLEKQRMIVDTL
ncbi:helix-turn-helix domain-containing protein [Parabacteroides sp. PF5-9]|uniref:helix-turn-helix domain-containing protein n=1 Tax=Parabacteroides sp. PF5-9 TaxID=1742404 RepID=UPI002476DB2C|nr:helix-turn-helix domain-containing protein [Parabacteroides sp. PF5-9]MDH6358813.1 hypothetical protein [Parabacteroides sp. PF5-9]